MVNTIIKQMFDHTNKSKIIIFDYFGEERRAILPEWKIAIIEKKNNKKIMIGSKILITKQNVDSRKEPGKNIELFNILEVLE